MTEPGTQRAPTGIAGLDRMLDGGLIPGRPYVVSGASGSGKTTLAIQFLQQGVKMGERTLLVAVDEPPIEIRENMRALGWDVGKIRILDVHPAAKAYSKKVSLVEVAAQKSVSALMEASGATKEKAEALKKVSPDLSLPSLQLMLKQELQEVRYSRLAIDSLTSIKRLAGPDEDLSLGIVSLLRFLSESEVTSILVTEQPDPCRLEPETFISRGEIRLHKTMVGSKLERYVTVEKFRGSVHDTMPRPLTITEKGIEVDTGRKISKAALKALQEAASSTR